MTERKKLSLGGAKTEAAASDKTRAWKISPKRAEALKERARLNRRHPSDAQKLLWEQLRDKKCGGFAFNREVVMGSTIVDFACKSRWLVVETGADDEAAQTLAELSDRKLTDVGVRVLRFADADVLEKTEEVLAAIEEELRKPFERPNAVGSAPRKPEGEQRFHRSRY